MPRTKQFDEDKVLDKAVEVFWRKGFHATSMQELVDHMGINRASLYDTFGGKEALFEKAFQRYRERSRQNIADFLNSHASVRDGLMRLFERTIEHAVVDPDAKGCFVVNAKTELAAGDQNFCHTLNRNREDLEQLFHHYLQSGVDRGEISPDKDLRTIASLLFTLYNGIMVLIKIDPDREKLLRTVRAGLNVLDSTISQ